MLALKHMIDSLAQPGGVSYDEYLLSCLATPVQTQNVANPIEQMRKLFRMPLKNLLIKGRNHSNAKFVMLNLN